MTDATPCPDRGIEPAQIRPPTGLFAGMVITGDAEIIRGGKVVTDNSDKEPR
jgi:hypothetical protein